MLAGPDYTNQERWPQHLLPSANPLPLTLSFVPSYCNTQSGKLLLAVTLSHYLRRTTHAGHPLLIQTQAASARSYTHQVIYLCTFMSPEGQGCPAFWGAAALRQFDVPEAARPNVMRQRGPRGSGMCCRSNGMLLTAAVDTTEGEFGVAGSTESYWGWKVRVTEGWIQTCICNPNYKAVAY